MLKEKYEIYVLFQSTPSVGRATFRSVITFTGIPRFQSTPSVGRATDMTDFEKVYNFISIHALRGEGDQKAGYIAVFSFRFQSTPSVGRATHFLNVALKHNMISIHALRGEGDCLPNLVLRVPYRISIHALRGEGDVIGWAQKATEAAISIHALRGEGDFHCSLVERFVFISIHALRGEGDCKNIQIYNIAFVHSAYKIIYFCDSCAFYLT